MADDRRQPRIAKKKLIPRWCEQRANAVKCYGTSPIFVKYRNRIRTKRCTEVADLPFPAGEFFGRDIGDRRRSVSQCVMLRAHRSEFSRHCYFARH